MYDIIILRLKKIVMVKFIEDISQLYIEEPKLKLVVKQNNIHKSIM